MTMQRYDALDEGMEQNADGDYVLYYDAEREIDKERVTSAYYKVELGKAQKEIERLLEDIAAAEQRGAERGRQEERAAIVAWFRDPASVPDAIALYYAEEIERGDHHAHGREAQP